MEKMNDLRDLLIHEIQDLYSAEEQIIAALPAMVDKAKNPELKNALQMHLKVTNQQKSRLDQVQKLLSAESSEGGKGLLARLFKGRQTCRGMQGIIEEGTKVMKEDMDQDVMDAAIIASSQKIEHYEICGYGTAKAFAEELGLTEVARLLDQTLNEEYMADDMLTQMAVGRINRQAESGNGSKGASGSRTSGARSGSSERVRSSEPEMEMASSSRSGGAAKKTAAAGRGGGAPKGSESERSITPGRTTGAASKRSTSASTGNSSGSGSARSTRGGSSSTSGRGSTGNGRSRGR